MTKEHTARIRVEKARHDAWTAHALASGYEDFSSWARQVLTFVMQAQRSGLAPPTTAMKPAHVQAITLLMDADRPKKKAPRRALKP